MQVPTNFYLDGKLYKKLRVIPSENVLVAWCYPNEKRTWIDYSLVKKNCEKAYTLDEVSDLLEKSKDSLTSLLQRGLLGYPSARVYSIKNKMPGKYYWSESDVLATRDQLYNLAPKNKNNEPHVRFKLVSRAHLLAKMRGDNSLYVKDSVTGEYIKVWKAL